jgi:hypothetical protein
MFLNILDLFHVAMPKSRPRNMDNSIYLTVVWIFIEPASLPVLSARGLRAFRQCLPVKTVWAA